MRSPTFAGNTDTLLAIILDDTKTGANNMTSEKPRLLFIGPYPPPYSGPEIGMKEFLDSELRQYYELHFLKTNVRKTNVNKGRLDWTSFFAYFRFVIGLVFLLLCHRPALVYYPVTATQMGWIGRDCWCLWICRLFRVKCIAHLRAGHFKLNFARFHPVSKFLVTMACKGISLILLQSECLTDQFQELVPAKRVGVIRNSVNVHEYDTQDLDDYDRSQIFFMGHLTKAKGYCDLVRAMPLVLKKHPNAKFCFAGTLRRGERNVFFNQITGEKIIYEDPIDFHEETLRGLYSKNYNFLGLITGKTKLYWLRKTNIYVLPSYSEGLSKTILEAMAVGKPIICTPVGAHKDIIRDGTNGFFVSPGDSDAIARRICKLLKDQDLRMRIARENYKYVRENFALDIVIEKMRQHIERTLQSE